MSKMNDVFDHFITAHQAKYGARVCLADIRTALLFGARWATSHTVADLIAVRDNGKTDLSDIDALVVELSQMELPGDGPG